ncbi:MAG TPA: ADOP family duplicated permease [Bryobacteraceae bacterium]|nr:ADOP family duplicated permease [Bryobacteraceae bacterium]
MHETGHARNSVIGRSTAASHIRVFLANVSQDVKYGARMLGRTPGFTAAAFVCLSIGIGVTAATFSQLRSGVFRELPGSGNPGSLVRLERPVPFSDYEDFRDRSGLFDSLAAYMAPIPAVVARPGEQPERVWGHVATPDYFQVLGAKPALGRLFGAEERGQGAGQVAVLSHRLWRARFGGDPSIIGRPIRVNGRPVTVLGVASEDFLGASPLTSAAAIWIPTTAGAAVIPELRRLGDRRTAFDVIGRLRTDLSYSKVEEALDLLVRRLDQAHGRPVTESKERLVRVLPGGRVFPLRNEDVPRAIGFPLLLVGLVLLMACGNVANMLVARGAARRRELSVRVALGASRGRIVRQLLIESLMLGVLGGAGGVAFAFTELSFIESLRPMMPGYIAFETRLDWRSLVFAAVVAVGSGLLFGIVPALQTARAGIYAGLKRDGTQVRAPRWFSLRNVLVFQQVTAAVVLLLLTGIVVMGWHRSSAIDTGYNAANLYTLALDPVRDGYSADATLDFFDKLPHRLERVPGITAVGLAQTLPLAMSSGEAIMSAKVDFVEGAKSSGAIRAERFGAGFLEALGARLVRGRTFVERDQREDSRVIIVNETMAAKLWPGEDALGQTLSLERARWQVIGVVRDLRSALPLAPPQPSAYQPATPSGFATPSRHGVIVVVRVAPDFDVPTRLRREIAAIDANLTVFQVKRMSDEVDQLLYLARFGTLMYGGMGMFGLILSAVGLAGVTAYAVARRTHEIGIRMALGARRANVLWLVLREGSAIIAAGVVVGVAVALGLLRAVSHFAETLAETTRASASDPLLLVGAPALLAALALAACYLPARRSTRVDPVTALRSE